MASRVSLVNLQKFTFWACVDLPSMRILAPAQNTLSLPDLMTTQPHLRVLEAQPLHRVVELDIDAEVVGVELELVAVEQPAGLIDVHDQISDVAVALDAPMAVARRLGLEIDGLHGLAPAAGLRYPLPFSLYALFCISIAFPLRRHNSGNGRGTASSPGGREAMQLSPIEQGFSHRYFGGRNYIQPSPVTSCLAL